MPLAAVYSARIMCFRLLYKTVILSEPREVPRCLRRINCSFGSLPFFDVLNFLTF
jgi:hypothetical protein